MYIGDFEYQHIGFGNLKVSMGRTLWLSNMAGWANAIESK